MRKLFFLLLAAACTMAAFPAEAGTIAGKIQVATASTASMTSQQGDKENVVVWLEDETKAPDTPLRISQKNLEFSPDFLIAVKGQKVEMPNDDDVAHNVFSFTGPNQFNLGLYAKGEYRTVTFEKTGIVDIFCSIHRHMHARIFVLPSRYFAVGHAGQTFAINDVPPGKHILKAWHERSLMVVKTVIVPKSGTVNLNILLEPGATPVTSAKE
ncbi:MAG TPA: hypothetical protein VKZ53_00860 [Candidatus Angelobacter sp.]|nr:hypothetical protein [Candidatus Angelobacter sp.]